MAYMSQEHKARLAPTIRAICKRHGVKATLSVRHHSSLVLTVKQGSINFYSDFNGEGLNRNYHIQVNPYHYGSHFTGRALAFLKEVVPAMYGPDYFDESDIQTDYFHCSHYVNVNIGRWDQPYALVK
jgi:hypothetical protein